MLRFGQVALRRPDDIGARSLPDSVRLSYVEVVEQQPPSDSEPLHWRLLTTHPLSDAKERLADRRLVCAALDDRATVPCHEAARL